ncbi:response regulator transcription factor [Pseudomonas sp. Bout1]|uniref:response regulator transcription factor n=1 Tax=Pseudomonas sp. Bout1 TaxID=3048600 RepID=UPI002AB41A1D|nr:response regulator transcription factor [Pseudomonas sp. Bout1]MDY7536394.1 response regulator transcription factor [Pseudomonas sp. Bout1]MEB0183443.1 response regulator transcription factor [Pseudomonas sp. Bout1]
MAHQILLVDDHPAVRMAVAHLLEAEGLHVAAQTDNGVDALRLLETLQPCTVILDIGIPGIDGLTVINRIVARNWAVKIIVLTGLEPGHMASRCLQSGAHGFVNKQSDLCELVNAVRAVHANYSYFPSQTCCSVGRVTGGEEQKKLESLSTRELRVLQHLAQGLSNKEIADRMLLSGKTISTYKSRLLYKLNATSVVELFVIAKRNNLT